MVLTQISVNVSRIASDTETSDEPATWPVPAIYMDDVPSTSGLGVVGLTKEAVSLLATETVYDALTVDDTDLTIDDADKTSERNS